MDPIALFLLTNIFFDLPFKCCARYFFVLFSNSFDRNIDPESEARSGIGPRPENPPLGLDHSFELGPNFIAVVMEIGYIWSGSTLRNFDRECKATGKISALLSGFYGQK